MRFEPEVVFNQLIELECGSIRVDTMKAFPAIRLLWVMSKTRGEFLKHLPAAQMLSLLIQLGISDDDDEDENDEDEEEGIADHDVAEELESSAAAISGMRHLKELDLTVGCVYWQKRPDLSHGLSSMFHELHELESVSIRVRHEKHDHCRFNGWLVGEEIASSLVQQNPNLRDVYFDGINSTHSIAGSAAASV